MLVISGEELLVFGDGYVEIEEVTKVGGTAVGVASAEPDCRQIDPWKRNRLISVGADLIVPNYEQSSMNSSHALFSPRCCACLLGAGLEFHAHTVPRVRQVPD